jgi:hypothetical protein
VKKEAFRVVATALDYSGYPIRRHNLRYLAGRDEGRLNLVGGPEIISVSTDRAPDQSNGRRYSTKEIEAFLSAIDNNTQNEQSLRKGPFSMFEFHPRNMECSSLYETQYQDQISIPRHIEEGWLFEHFQEYASPTDLQVGDNSQVDTTSIATYERSAAAERSNTISETATLATYENTKLPMQNIQLHFSENTGFNMLMHHYIVNIVDVIQPIQHLHNAYRDLYVPAALEGSIIPTTDSYANDKPSHSALFHALLSAAAFHLWNCDKSQTRYRQIGAQHRYHALHLLQSAVDSETATANYKTLLTTMLALVTISVSSRAFLA